MPLVVLPNEITEGLLPHNKWLRGFVVETKSKTVAGGNVVVEIHDGAKDDPCEVYLLEAWGAIATRAEKLQQKRMNSLSLWRSLQKEMQRGRHRQRQSGVRWELQNKKKWMQLDSHERTRQQPWKH